MAQAEAPSGRAPPLSLRAALALVGAAVVAYLTLWGTWLVLPVRWFVTLVHESGHALMVEAVGGDTIDLTINPSGGGLTRSRIPGSSLRSLLVSSAGYLFAALFGAALLGSSRRVRSAQVVFAALGVLSLAVAFLWVPWDLRLTDSPLTAAAGSGSGDGRFTWIFCLCAAAALFGVAFFAPTRLRQALAVVLAALCCVSALGDLRRLVGFSVGLSHEVSDATVAEEATGIDAWFWAILWAGIAVAVVVAGLRSLARGPR